METNMIGAECHRFLGLLSSIDGWNNAFILSVHLVRVAGSNETLSEHLYYNNDSILVILESRFCEFGSPWHQTFISINERSSDHESLGSMMEAKKSQTPNMNFLYFFLFNAATPQSTFGVKSFTVIERHWDCSRSNYGFYLMMLWGLTLM